MPRSTWRCTACSKPYPKWQGFCSCGEAGTIEEGAPQVAGGRVSAGVKTARRQAPVARAPRLGDVDASAHTRRSTGLGEVDRALGGGLTAGSTSLLMASPGAGKSTLALQIAAYEARSGGCVLIAAGEESAAQVKARADRLGVGPDLNIHVVTDPDISVIIAHIDTLKPTMLILDSLQTMASPDVDGRAGGVAQLAEVTQVLNRVCKENTITGIFVSQVTKSVDNFSGPQAVAHEVDSVIALEAPTDSPLRTLRVSKNRHGEIGMVAYMRHTETGLEEVSDPSALFTAERAEPTPGSALTVTMDGTRAITAEVQALLAPTQASNPRRVVSGMPAPRVQMLLAVAERHAGVKMWQSDAYVSTVGGASLTDPGADLAVVLAVASSALDIAVPHSLAAIGEVALSGDVRPVGLLTERLREAARMGFRTVLVPGKAKFTAPEGLSVVRVDHVTRAINAIQSARAAT